MKPEKILLVDDEKIVLETVGDDLKEAGFSVVKANNGAEGLRQFQSGKFDLVISDLMMDEMDGFAVLKEIKKNLQKLPLLL
jgi:two-component system response regulator GlrR